MTAKNELPQNRWQRQGIIILDEDDITYLENHPTGVDILLNKEVHVLAHPFDKTDAILRDLIDSGLDKPRTMLLQSPFDQNSYEEMSVAPQTFSLKKLEIFSALCGVLGAKEVKVVQIDVRNSSGTSTIRVEANSPVGMGHAKVSQEEMSTIRNIIELSHKFSGGDADLKAAEHLLKRYGLWNDTNMRSIVDMRSVKNNQLLSRKLHLDLTSEIKRILNVAGKIIIPTYLTEIRSSLHKVIQAKTEYELTIEVDF